MNRTLLVVALLGIINQSYGQITITGNDMPVIGDTLRYSQSNPLTFSANLSDIGTNKTWDFSTVLQAESQKVDEYKSVLQVNPLFAVTLSPTAYGYKVADTFGAAPGGITIPIPLPVTITDVYTFYSQKQSPDRFVAEGFAASVVGTGIPAAYNDEDELYFLPLVYGNNNNSDFLLRLQIPTLGTIVQKGSRNTTVDAWGTIKTPYFTTPTDCIRVRSQINEVDSIQLPSLPAIGLPRVAVDYKWLVQGEHYPALWVSATVVGGQEMVTAVRYKDNYKPTSIQKTSPHNTITKIEVYPNPATDYVQLVVPAGTAQYVIEVFNIEGKLVSRQYDGNKINITALPSGNYIARLTSTDGTGYAGFVKQ